MLVEGVIDADGEAIAHPIVKHRVVKELVIYQPNKFGLADFERMLELKSVAISPCIKLRFAPPSLDPVATIKSKLAERHAQIRADRAALFSFMPAVRWSGVTMEI